MGPDYWMGSGFPWMWIFPVIFVVFIIWMMSGRGSMCGGSHGKGNSRDESAQDILDKRFARGEITQREYEDMKKTING